MWLAQPFLRRRLRHRGVSEPGYLQAMEERFGHYASQPWRRDGNTVWVHAVSLGETRAAAALVAGLRRRWPGMRLLLTHGTATGRAEGVTLLRSGDSQTWQPWDTPEIVQRFLLHFQPRIGILMETEVWPNLVSGCQQMKVPLVLANARMSEKTQQMSRRLSCLSRPALGALSAVWAQSQTDARRLRGLGANVDGVFGNLKFDATPDARQLADGQAWRRQTGRPVVMLASSRAGEEAALLQILESYRANESVNSASAAINLVAHRIQWLVVPRHPQRFDEVAALIEAQGFVVSRRSAWGDAPPAGGSADRAAIWLGDSLGEMARYYALADVALLGGSFEPLGGQNLIEAAACACPLVMGPHTFNFAEAAELAVAAGAALRVPSLPAAVALACQLAADPARCATLSAAAAGFASSHRGAVEQTASAVLALLAQQAVDAL
jgi:3-deoxy-D-manno-octulosonic-acid transferase